jgi:hypothetical protein
VLRGRVDVRAGGREGGWTSGRVDERLGGREGGWTRGREDEREIGGLVRLLGLIEK